MPGWLKLQPAAVGSAAAAVYVAAAMLYRAYVAKDAVFQPDEVVAAFMALYGLFVHQAVTPLARPRASTGEPLVIRGHVESEYRPQSGGM